MICANLGGNWPSGFGEDDFLTFHQCITLFRNYISLGKGVALHSNKFESPTPKDDLCQVWWLVGPIFYWIVAFILFFPTHILMTGISVPDFVYICMLFYSTWHTFWYSLMLIPFIPLLADPYACFACLSWCWLSWCWP